MNRLGLAAAIAWRVFVVVNVVVFLGWNLAAWYYVVTAHAWVVESPWTWCGGLAVQSSCHH